MKPQQTDVLAPHPVHPRAIRNHGMFGASFVRQHMVIDDRWSAVSVLDEFQGMTNLLSKRLLFKLLENRAYRKSLYKSTKALRTQCRDGRTKLQNVLIGDNVHTVRNYLINHKDMQRLYQKMPVHLVVDNINQRTFVMRKERDRLEYRLKQLKMLYEHKLKTRADLSLRIKYQNEFILDEELKGREFMKEIENSNARLKAIKAIHATYKKIMEVLRHDAIFYEPILRSLCADIDDQASFVKHILYLGTPAIAKFKQLSEEYRQVDDKTRKSSMMKSSAISGYAKSAPRTLQPSKSNKDQEMVIDASKRYTRETKSMLTLKNQLDTIEYIIKQIKVATLCSQATEIFPRIKSQVESNFRLLKENGMADITSDFHGYKAKVAEQQHSVLINNYFEEEERRTNRIKKLKEEILKQDKQEEAGVRHMKERSAMFVLLRFHLWNLMDILRHVGQIRPIKYSHLNYSTTYLKLPLLKFEMYNMYAVAPEVFEENTKVLLQTVLEKLRTLKKAYKELDRDPNPMAQPALDRVAKYRDEYHRFYLIGLDTEDTAEDRLARKGAQDSPAEDSSGKINATVPSRKTIKGQSTRLLEEMSKKDEQ